MPLVQLCKCVVIFCGFIVAKRPMIFQVLRYLTGDRGSRDTSPKPNLSMRGKI